MTMRLTADFSAAPVSPGRRWTHISKRESNCQPKILSPAKQPFEKADEIEIFLATKQNRTTGGRWAPRRLREGRFSRARSGKTENGPGRKVSGVGTHGEEGRVSRERPLAAPLPLPTGPGTWLRRSPLRHPRSQNFSLYQIISSGLQVSYLSLHLQRSPCPHVSDSRHLVPLLPLPLPLKTAVLIFHLPFVPSEPLLNQLRTQTCSPTGPPELSSPTTSALLGPCSALSPPGA